jgi:hypothetical protein
VRRKCLPQIATLKPLTSDEDGVIVDFDAIPEDIVERALLALEFGQATASPEGLEVGP